jgi:hypothetical protein
MIENPSRGVPGKAMRFQMPPHRWARKGRLTMKFRLYKLAFALGSLAAIVEILGAGRRF